MIQTDKKENSCKLTVRSYAYQMLKSESNGFVSFSNEWSRKVNFIPILVIKMELFKKSVYETNINVNFKPSFFCQANRIKIRYQIFTVSLSPSVSLIKR